MKMSVRLTLNEEMLGTASSDPAIHEQYIAAKAPNAPSREEEVAALGVDEVIEKGMTVFPLVDGKPVLWDYQIKGFFKDACGMLTRTQGTKSSQLKAYKKIIDGLVFPTPRSITIQIPEGGDVGNCQRPLRADTAQGPRIALANSETVPIGSVLEFDIRFLPLKTAAKPGPDGKEKKNLIQECIEEWLDYGELRGLGQWRNSGKGRFSWELVTSQ